MRTATVDQQDVLNEVMTRMHYPPDDVLASHLASLMDFDAPHSEIATGAEMGLSVTWVNGHAFVEHAGEWTDADRQAMDSMHDEIDIANGERCARCLSGPQVDRERQLCVSCVAEFNQREQVGDQDGDCLECHGPIGTPYETDFCCENCHFNYVERQGMRRGEGY